MDMEIDPGDIIYDISGRQIDEEILLNYINKAIKDGVSDKKPRNIADWILDEFDYEDTQEQNPAGPGYHDVTMEYNLGGKDYAQNC